MIQVRKNFEFELTSGDFAGGSNEYTLVLYVWQGEQSAIPASASYSLTKDIPSFSVDGVFDRINLSNLINDFIEYDQGTTGDSFCVWVRYEVFIDGIINNSLTFQDIALYGYTDNGTLLLDGRDFQIYDSFLIPVIDNTDLEILSFPDSQINITQSATNETNTNDKIITYQISRPSTDTYIRITNGLDIRYIYVQPLTKYGTSNIDFINSYGVLQRIPFLNKKNEGLNTEKKEYKAKNFPSGHKYVEFNKNGRKSISLRTGYYEQGINDSIEALVLSEAVYLNSTPVNVDSQSIETKTRLNDKSCNYDIDFKISDDIIDVR